MWIGTFEDSRQVRNMIIMIKQNISFAGSWEKKLVVATPSTGAAGTAGAAGAAGI